MISLTLVLCSITGCEVVEIPLPSVPTMEVCNSTSPQVLPSLPLPPGVQIMKWTCAKGEPA